ncbi:MAG: hypothetical protein ACREQC_03170, partial [Candidatus Binataceae bacterium]
MPGKQVQPIYNFNGFHPSGPSRGLNFHPRGSNFIYAHAVLTAQDFRATRFFEAGLVPVVLHRFRTKEDYMATPATVAPLDHNVSSFVSRKHKILINGRWVEAASG